VVDGSQKETRGAVALRVSWKDWLFVTVLNFPAEEKSLVIEGEHFGEPVESWLDVESEIVGFATFVVAVDDHGEKSPSFLRSERFAEYPLAPI
jgi:hypothetical protein